MKVKKYVVIKPKLARQIFKELGNIEGLDRFRGLRKLEKIIVETLELDKED